jgi:diguanylate cyclase (GGDEF)-like protein/PAS domain S-box-containing protein
LNGDPLDPLVGSGTAGLDAWHYSIYADHSPDWEYWLGPDGRYRYVSPACADICGHAPAEFMADPELMTRLVHPDDLPIWREHTRDTTVADAAHQHVGIELRVRGADGGWRWIEHYCNALSDDTGRYLGRRGVNRDISERKRIESELANLSAVYVTLRAVYQAMVRAEDEAALLAEITRLCVELGGASACVISIGTEGSDELYPIAFHGLDLALVDAMPLHAPRGQGNIPPATVWEMGAAACCPDCRGQGIDAMWSAWSAQVGILACCHYPLWRGGRKYGLISFLADTHGFFQVAMRQLFQELATDLGHALDDFDTRYHQEQAQYSLSQNGTHLRAVLDGAPAGIGIVINRAFIEVNQRFCDMIGYEAAELIGESSRMVYSSDEEHARVGEVKYKQISEHGHGQVETRMRRKDGGIIEVLLSSTALDRNDLSKGVVFTVLDITAMREYERALRSTEARYRLIAENASDIISVHDVGGVCRFVTPACARILGRGPEAIVGQNFFKNIHPDDLAMVGHKLAELIGGGDPDPLEFRVLHEDGHVIWVESKASLIMGVTDTEILGITRDVTARKLAELDLIERQKRYRELVEHMSDGVAVYEATRNGEDFIIRDFNRAGERISGLKRDDVLGRHVTELFPGVRDLGLLDVFQRVWRGGAPELHPVSQYRDGRITLWVENYVFKLPNGEVVAIFTDMTEKKAAEERLRLTARLFDSTTEGMLVTDADNRILLVNQAFTEITGYSEAEMIGETPAMLASGRHDDMFYQTMWHAIEAHGTWRGEIWNRRKNGEVYPELLTIGVVKDRLGRLVNHTAVFADITQAKKSEEQLHFIAHHDPLTGLPNRALLHARLEHALQRATRDKSRLALILIDLDRFKQVNDTLGHPVGDTILQQVASYLSDALRAGDTVARLGGDEFLVLMEDIKQASDAALGAGKLMDTFKRPFGGDAGDPLYLTASLGISVYPDDASDAESLLRTAEVALYRAKEQGRNTYRFFEATMAHGALDRLRLENALRGALARGEIEAHYQLQYDLGEHAVVGAEALMRWRHPDFGLVPPGVFIPIAEDIGVIDELGAWILERACAQVVAWEVSGLALPVIAVNLSMRQLDNDDLAGRVRDILARTGLAPARLELEITESMIMRREGPAGDILRALQALGVRLAVDDFGTGYSSLGYLKRLPLHRLKIDQSFVRDIGVDANGEAITQAIIAMGNSLGLEVVAEGIETEAQAVFLRDGGCRLGQGYLFARPMPADQVLASWRG